MRKLLFVADNSSLDEACFLSAYQDKTGRYVPPRQVQVELATFDSRTTWSHSCHFKVQRGQTGISWPISAGCAKPAHKLHHGEILRFHFERPQARQLLRQPTSRRRSANNQGEWRRAIGSAYML